MDQDNKSIPDNNADIEAELVINLHKEIIRVRVESAEYQFQKCKLERRLIKAQEDIANLHAKLKEYKDAEAARNSGN